MSKRLLFNNTTKQIVDTNCPLCNHSQEECQCTVVDKLYIDWADAGRYANATACSTSSSYKSVGAYQYVTVYEFSTTTTNAQLFTERMTELGYVSTDNNGGSDYYGLYVSVDKKTYYYWNYTLNGSPNKTLLNKLLTLDDVYFEQLKQYGKYFEKCDDCGNGIDNCTCYNVYEFTVNGSSSYYRKITLNTDRRGDTTAWDGYTDWGDGTKDTNSSHTYSSNKTYIVKTKYSLASTTGNINSQTYNYLTNVLNINSNITNMAYLFYDCSKLTELDISNLDTSNVTTMSYMFSGCTALTSLDISSFNTSNVTDMYGMFNSCTALTELDISNLDTSNVTTMKYMFRNCNKLTSLNMSNLNTSNVTDMYGMFSGCTALTSLDIGNIDTSNVTTMYTMFENCRTLTELDLSHFDISSVTTVQYMFYNCYALTLLNLSNWQMNDSCSYKDCFYGCRSLTKDNVITTNANETLINAVSSNLS